MEGDHILLPLFLPHFLGAQLGGIVVLLYGLRATMSEQGRTGNGLRWGERATSPLVTPPAPQGVRITSQGLSPHRLKSLISALAGSFQLHLEKYPPCLWGWPLEHGAFTLTILWADSRVLGDTGMGSLEPQGRSLGDGSCHSSGAQGVPLMKRETVSGHPGDVSGSSIDSYINNSTLSTRHLCE